MRAMDVPPKMEKMQLAGSEMGDFKCESMISF